MGSTEISMLSKSKLDWSTFNKHYALSPEATMDVVLHAIDELVNYELAVVLRNTGDGFLKVCRAKGPLATPELLSYAIPLETRTDLVKLLQAGKPRILDTSAGYRDTYADILDLPSGHSCLVAPLSLGTQTIGMLTLDHRNCGIFSDQLVSSIGAISQLIAIALMQTELAKTIVDRNNELVLERNRLLDQNADAFRNLVGSSTPWLRVLDSIKLVAATESPVLLLGETGTGKEEVARAIHALSTRANGPFIALNCSAMPTSLAESELFGHEKGSFTGAQALRRGRFELANGGTLFLDEIGDLPLEIQPKLLRALQEGKFERVGGETSISVDVRIIAATHVDLGEAIENARFREDLYYRIAVFPIHLPPLRERDEDALLISEHFLEKLRSRQGWNNLAFSADALDALVSKQWSGNVRELRNSIERAAILAKGGTITADMIYEEHWRRAGASHDPQASSAIASQASPTIGDTSALFDAPLEDTLLSIQKRIIESALQKSKGKIYGPQGAANLLKIKPSTLQGKMKKLGIER